VRKKWLRIITSQNHGTRLFASRLVRSVFLANIRAITPQEMGSRLRMQPDPMQIKALLNQIK
jgi:hypothetical protein